MRLTQALNAAGIDAAVLKSRFMDNEALIARFIGKFPSDPTYAELRAAEKEDDTDKIFRAAHTLKGIAGNLGMDVLCGLCSDLVEYIRSGGSERDKIAEYCNSVGREYERLTGIFSELE